MKVTYSPNSRFTFEVEATTHVELWEQLAEIDELYKDLVCRKKDKGETDSVRFVVRTDSEDNKYYELWADVPFGHALYGTKKAFGAHKKGGGLFPKRKEKVKDEAGNEKEEYLPDNGWVQWDKEQQKNV